MIGVECDQCRGTGYLAGDITEITSTRENVCPGPHVVLEIPTGENYYTGRVEGGRVFADPGKIMRWCDKHRQPVYPVDEDYCWWWTEEKRGVTDCEIGWVARPATTWKEAADAPTD